MNKKFLAFFIFFMFQSCQLFDKKVPDEKQLLNQELKKIDWKNVDEWPTFVQCDSLVDKESQKMCFYNLLSSQLQEKLQDDSIAKLLPNIDSIQVKVTIFSDAKVSFEPILNDSLVVNRHQLDSVFQLRLASFPAIQPALKRGMPVKTEVQLPIVLHK